jgi:hypothetical protein
MLRRNNGMAWFGFWIFMSVLLACDTYLFSKGYDSMFWVAKTAEEKQIREQTIKGCNK